MFPLESVLLPGMVLALHVFEPRFRALVHTALLDDSTFGVVLIERGREVGGDDVRFDIGCRAVIVDAKEQPDGRWHIFAVGVDRLRVLEWLPDDPFPRAIVQAMPEPDAEPRPEEERQPDAAPGSDAEGDRFSESSLLDTAWREFAALRSALVARYPEMAEQPYPERSGDASSQCYAMALASPIGVLDRLNVLKAGSTSERCVRLIEAFEVVSATLRMSE